MPHDGQTNEVDGDSRRAAVSKVLIADRHPVVREGLIQRLSREPDFQVCGACSTVAETIAKCEATPPDILVMEISFADGSGLDCIQHIQDHALGARVLIYSMLDPKLCVRRARHDGAWGFVSKDCTTDQFVEVLRLVRDGKRYFPESTEDGAEQPGDGKGDGTIDTLSRRELEVFRLMGEGLDMHDVAQRMGLSVKTVETYRARIRKKLHVASRMQLVRRAVEWMVEQRQTMPPSSSDHGGKPFVPSAR